MGELEKEDPQKFKNMLRMELAMFNELEARLTPRLLKNDTNYWRALPPRLKLAITLKYLATGDHYKTHAGFPGASQHHRAHHQGGVPSHHRSLQGQSHPLHHR